MTEIIIRIQEVLINDKPKMAIDIKNMRSDDATQNEKIFCNVAESEIEQALTSKLKNVEVIYRSRWVEEKDGT